MEKPSIFKTQGFIFGLGWIAYASSYFIRKPLGIIKVDMESELALTKSSLGWLDMALLLPYAVMQMLLGSVGDKFGARRTFGLCLIFSALSMISFGYWSNFYMFIILLFLNGTAQSLCWPTSTKVLLSWFSDDVRNSVFGVFGTCVFVGGIVSTVVAVYLQTNYGWRRTYFWPSLFVMAVGFLVVLFYRSADELKMEIMSKENDANPAIDGQMITMWEVWRMPMVMEAAVGMFCLKVVRYSMYMWLPMYLLQQLQYAKSTAGILSTVFEVGGVVGSALMGFFVDKLLQKKSMLGSGLSMAFSAAALVMFALTGSWGMPFHVLFLFLAGAFNAGPDSVLGGAIPAEIAKDDGRNAIGATVGFVNGFGSLGSCLEGPMVGIVSTYYGWESMFYLMTALSALAAITAFHASALSTKKHRFPSISQESLL